MNIVRGYQLGASLFCPGWVRYLVYFVESPGHGKALPWNSYLSAVVSIW